MLNTDEDAIICDFAETYHIFNYKGLSVQEAATLCLGLRDNSRLKMKIAGLNVETETLLLASMVDRLAILIWMQTEDGHNNRNFPKSIVQSLTGATNKDSDVMTFDSAEDFEEYRRKLLSEV